MNLTTPVAKDLRGHGLTTTTGVPEQRDESRLVEDVRAVVEAARLGRIDDRQ
jgi:pimeloyl-ACP methyl ester carboxylesterase